MPLIQLRIFTAIGIILLFFVGHFGRCGIRERRKKDGPSPSDRTGYVVFYFVTLLGFWGIYLLTQLF